MRGLNDLVSSGRVHYVGISDAPAWVVSQANTLAEERGWTTFVGLQIQYSLVERTPERDLLPMARAFGMSVTPWAVLGSGVLTGKYGRKEQGRRTQLGMETSPEEIRIAAEVDAVAKEVGCTPS